MASSADPPRRSMAQHRRHRVSYHSASALQYHDFQCNNSRFYNPPYSLCTMKSSKGSALSIAIAFRVVGVPFWGRRRSQPGSLKNNLWPSYIYQDVMLLKFPIDKFNGASEMEALCIIECRGHWPAFPVSCHFPIQAFDWWARMIRFVELASHVQVP